MADRAKVIEEVATGSPGLAVPSGMEGMLGKGRPATLEVDQIWFPSPAGV